MFPRGLSTENWVSHWERKLWTYISQHIWILWLNLNESLKRKTKNKERRMKVGQIEQGCFLPSLQVWTSSLVDTKNESYILCFLTSHQLGGSWWNLAYSADKGSKIYQCCQEPALGTRSSPFAATASSPNHFLSYCLWCSLFHHVLFLCSYFHVFFLFTF